MKFYNYLNEDIDENLSEIKDILFHECKPILKEYKSQNIKNFLFSGKEYHIRHFKVKKTRKDRSPKDTPNEVHELFDKKLYQKYKIYGRSQCLFTTGSTEQAANYGSPNIIFPIGKYRYLWSPEIIDLWTYIERSGVEDYIYNETRWIEQGFEDDYKMYHDENEEDYSSENMEDYVLSKVEDWKNENENFIKEIINSYKTTNLKSAINSKNEVMLECDEYLMINVMYNADLSNWLKTI